mmetsp:Transcript_13401/g.18483  ORF Transcript_13401/g.18483 Transcript_13401/m.18483 type:complete len:180 (-) Transcript_13401:246-785(-)
MSINWNVVYNEPITHIGIKRYDRSQISFQCPGIPNTHLRDREDTHWGVVFNGRYLVHARISFQTQQWDIEWKTENTTQLYDTRILSVSNLTIGRIQDQLNAGLSYLNCHDFCKQIYRMCGEELQEGQEQLTNKVIGVAELGVGASLFAAGVFIFTGPVGWICGGTGAALAYLGYTTASS